MSVSGSARSVEDLYRDYRAARTRVDAMNASKRASLLSWALADHAVIIEPGQPEPFSARAMPSPIAASVAGMAMAGVVGGSNVKSGPFDRALFSIQHAAMVLQTDPSALAALFCERIEYCGLVKRYKSEIDLCKAVADGLASAKVSFPVPIATVAVYLVCEKGLNRVCHCD